MVTFAAQHYGGTTNKSTDLVDYDALLFDLDGVLTPTAVLHRQAWAQMFSDYFESHSLAPYTEQDYFDYLDGRRRDEGITALLAAREITLPHDRAEQGDDTADSPDDDTVVGLGLRKNADFLSLVRKGIDPYEGSLALIKQLIASSNAPAMAVVTSSKNAEEVLAAADLKQYFSHVVDGNLAVRQQLAGKPKPDTYIYGAELCGVDPSRTVVFEDATSGVASGAAGNFGLVVGVDRGAGQDALLAAGADIVVEDLAAFVQEK